MNGEELLAELLRRRDNDQAARAAVPTAGRDAYRHAMAVDDDNAAWLKKVLDTVGWPGRSLVGEEGSHAAWLLAQHADRRPGLQRRCLELLEVAAAAGEASAADLAYLTDRVLLASGESQIYGTQFTGQEGRYVACRLRDPATVDDRRASAGLGTLQESLDRALELYGPPAPAHVMCPTCGGEIETWLPEMGSSCSIQCRACRSVMTLRPHISGGDD
jgi:hypothetical protein